MATETQIRTPFVYGRIAEKATFTNRKKETEQLLQCFSGLVNTTLISPRRWGKTSLVNHVAAQWMSQQKNHVACKIDIFSCRTEEDFYATYAKSILQATQSTWKGFVQGVKKYLGHLIPSITLAEGTTNSPYEISFGFNTKGENLSFDEMLDLPQKIAADTGKKLVVCIDEFQNITKYNDALGFQQKLRSHWQLHRDVSYCLYGSKRHMLLDIFNNPAMPFYRFGEIIFLEKITENDWVKFIGKCFRDSGKSIADSDSRAIAAAMQNHPYYVQQLSQQVWLRTQKVCSATIITEALESLVDQLSLLFTNVVDSLTPKQINFLLAVAQGEQNFSSVEVLKKYNLGTSANIKNLRNATLEKDLIDVLPGNKICLQDPVFEFWLKTRYKR